MPAWILLVVDVVEMSVIMGAGKHSLVSRFAVNNSNLAITDAMTVDARV